MVRMVGLTETIFVFAVLGIVSIWSYQKKFLDNEGLVVANFVGLSVFYYGDLNAFFTLIAFFGVGELATLFQAGRKKKQKHAERNIGNILGNALPAIIALILGSPIGFFSGIAASLADTLSSEIGILSKGKPRLITTWKEADYGTDGAVSGYGFLAAFVGASVMAIIAWLITQNLGVGILVLGMGLVGTILDSVLGATIQPRGWVDNNEVNFISSGLAALIGFSIAYIL